MKPSRLNFFVCFSGLFFIAAVQKFDCSVFAAEVLPGVEVLIRDHAKELVGKRVGILTNPTGVDRNLSSTIDLVRALPGVNVVRLFAPEHGVRGGFYAGEKVDESRDPVSGLPIASLYGKARRPTTEMLSGLDIVLYDIQDVGVRHYTFVSTLTYMMEECEKAGVAVWVLDRPEPMGGMIVGGPVMEESHLTFIGVHTVPTVYGMTPGEWAKMIKAERTPKLELRVIPLKGWKRGMNFGDLGWSWVSPSQHIPHWQTSFFYAITGDLGELGGLNVGVGTPLPFEQIGAPGVDGVKLAAAMNALKLPGVQFRAATFTPKYNAYQGQACQGIQIHIRDYSKVDPMQINFELMSVVPKVAPQLNLFRKRKGEEYDMFSASVGDTKLLSMLADSGDPHTQSERLKANIQSFLTRRQKYLIYP